MEEATSFCLKFYSLKTCKFFAKILHVYSMLFFSGHVCRDQWVTFAAFTDICKKVCPNSIVTDDGYKQLWKQLWDGNVHPSRKTIRDDVQMLYMAIPTFE